VALSASSQQPASQRTADATMATKVNYRNIPRFLLLLLGALMLSLIMQERLNLSRPMGTCPHCTDT
jgi:hypothetical protein